MFKKKFTKCRICQKPTRKIISLGKMPIANQLVEKIGFTKPLHHLFVVLCPYCKMVQLGKTVSKKLLFNKNYPFRSSSSEKMVSHFTKTAREILTKLNGKSSPLIVEIGSNDGAMLSEIAKNKIRHLGIEPCGDVARIARKKGLSIEETYFNHSTAKTLTKKYGQADIIYSANTISHIDNLNSVFIGLVSFLKNDGLLIIEDPYLPDIIKKTSFDQLYDEHVYYFSLLSLINLAKFHNLSLIDFKHFEVHGGSTRYYFTKGNFPPSAKVKNYLIKEKRQNLDKITGYRHFIKNVKKIKADLKQILTNIKKQGKSIAGYGATAKSATLLNYVGIGPQIIDYITDNTPTKIGKYTPGTSILIKSRDYFLSHLPDYCLLFAWNHQREIFQKEKKCRQKGLKFILYFPKVRIV